MSELKPCPFCRGEAVAGEIRVSNHWRNSFWEFSVTCGNFECEAKIGGKRTRKESIDAWNRRADNWVPVTEGLPEKESYVLVAFDDGFVGSTSTNDLGDWELWADSGEPTHWMQLPSPPKEAK